MLRTIATSDISVLMPIKNGRKFVEHALLNISDAAREAEILIVDDGSTDGSFEYCELFSRDYPTFKVLRNPGVGICDALNYGIARSTRRWIARFDVDDDYLPSRLSEQIEVVNSTNAVLVFSGYILCANGTTPFGSIPGAVLDIPTKLSLVTGRRTPHPSAMFLKELCVKAGGYLDQDTPAEDLSLWLRMSSLGQFATTENELLNYRLSASSVTIKNRAKSIDQRNAVLRKYPINRDYFVDTLTNLDSIFKQYSQMSSPGKRTALLLLDILCYSSFYEVKIPILRYMRMIRELLRGTTLIAGFQLFLEARRRDNFRMSLLKHE